MIKNVFLIIVFTIINLIPIYANSNKSKANILIKSYNYKNKKISSILRELKFKQNIPIAYENVIIQNDKNFVNYFDNKLVNIKGETITLENIFNIISDERKIFSWSYDTNIINVVAEPLIKMKDKYPLNATISEYDFEGSVSAILNLIKNKLDNNIIILTDIKEKNIENINFKYKINNISLRKFLNIFSKKNNIDINSKMFINKNKKNMLILSFSKKRKIK
jgi:hypothetical protein